MKAIAFRSLLVHRVSGFATNWRSIAATVLLTLLTATSSDFRAAEPNRTVSITLPASDNATKISGRLFVFFSQREREPRNGPDWFNPEPFYARDVADFSPGSTELIDDKADGFPGKISELKPGKYQVQALLHQDFYAFTPARGIGNRYSESVTLEVTDEPWSLELTLTKQVEARPMPEREWIKPIIYRSELLSDFFHRDVEDRAVVILPKSYAEHPDRRYPVLYTVSGFGGTVADMARAFAERPPEAKEGEIDPIRVMLSGECRWGHHVYADSATNGPRGRVLVEELIPRIDQQFRTVAAPQARFVSGHSSGGWSSLWIQIQHPDVFGGVWSTAPDPVDFRDYQATNLYHNPAASLYFDDQGGKKPIARRNGMPVLWYADFGKMDDCLGYGGQLRSFEAVFSPLDANGLPQRMWDRTTGRIDPAVVEAWKKYDINLHVREHWPTLGPKLAGKIHIAMGELDTFYLEGATRLLKQTFAELQSDAEVEMVPDADHGSLLSRDLISRHRKQMLDAYLKFFDIDGHAKNAANP